MIPENIPDLRSARKQIADPGYKAQRVRELRGKLRDCYEAAANTNVKVERQLYLQMSERYIKRIKWYLR
jgi:hypothetical protein